MMTEMDAEKIAASGHKSMMIRSLLGCKSEHGVCSRCYGANLANGQPIAIGEAVGVIAAQSIGEPGTQLTMRTFHTGGIASASDITQGLPRVEELFEARKPKNAVIIAHIGGVVSFEKDPKGNDFVVVANGETAEKFEKQIIYGSTLKVAAGDVVEKGAQLTEGSVEPAEFLMINGEMAVQDYLIQEVQRVYRTQGVDINDKHIEVIVRQMMRKIKVDDQGDTDLITGSVVSKHEFAQANVHIDQLNAADNGSRRHATSTPLLLGITKASLATESFMSAAAFQETTRVLTEAAIQGKADPLVGLKENVIIGKLNPAGTGTVVYSKYEKERRSIPMPSFFSRAMKQAEEETAIGHEEEKNAGKTPFNTPIFVERA